MSTSATSRKGVATPDIALDAARSPSEESTTSATRPPQRTIGAPPIAGCCAGAWLSRHVEAPLPAHTATVVFHTIVWQYLPAATRDHLRRTLTSAAAHATVQNPLCWLRMEPATPTHADLRLTVWPSGAEIHLADVGYHGHGLEWLVG